MKKLVYSWFLLAILFGCGHDSIKKELVRADSLMREFPDSALLLLDNMKGRALEFSEENRMLYELLYADACNKAYKPVEGDSLLKVVAEYYERKGTPNEKLRAYYILGCAYRDKNDVPMALQNYQKAVENRYATDAQCDPYVLYSVYGQMAELYFLQFLPNEELSALSECERIALEHNNTFDAIEAYELRARSYSIMDEHDSVIAIAENARKRFIECGDTARAARTLCAAITSYIEKGMWETAKNRMDFFENKSQLFDEKGDIFPEFTVYNYERGRVALHYNALDSAEMYFRMMLGTDEKEAAYKGLLSLYTKTHVPDSMAKYAVLYAEANDSGFIGRNVETTQRMTAMYNYGRYQNEAKRAADELAQSETEKSELLFLVIVLLGVFTATAYIYYKVRRKEIERINQLVSAEDYYKRQLLMAELDRQEEMRKYEEAMSLRNLKEEELAEIRARHEQELANRRQEIAELQANIEALETRLATSKSRNLKESFFETDIYSKFKDRSQPNSKLPELTKKEWKAMEDRFASYYGSFINKIKAPIAKPLTEEQVRACMLLHLGFNDSQVAELLNVNYPRVYRLKIQINEKLFAVSDAKSLRSNLAGLANR